MVSLLPIIYPPNLEMLAHAKRPVEEVVHVEMGVMCLELIIRALAHQTIVTMHRDSGHTRMTRERR